MSGENLIGLSRARRPHNAIFVNFDDEEIPTKPLDAAVQNWKKVCTNPVDKKAEEELRKVCALLLIWALSCSKLGRKKYIFNLRFLVIVSECE